MHSGWPYLEYPEHTCSCTVLHDFLYPVLNDVQLHSLLNLYDNINTSPDRPFRFPPTDACVRLKEAANALKVLEVTEDLAGDAEELREIVTRHHMMALIQVRAR